MFSLSLCSSGSISIAPTAALARQRHTRAPFPFFRFFFPLCALNAAPLVVFFFPDSHNEAQSMRQSRAVRVLQRHQQHNHDGAVAGWGHFSASRHPVGSQLSGPRWRGASKRTRRRLGGARLAGQPLGVLRVDRSKIPAKHSPTRVWRLPTISCTPAVASTGDQFVTSVDASRAAARDLHRRDASARSVAMLAHSISEESVPRRRV